jgi:hypothetical protein
MKASMAKRRIIYENVSVLAAASGALFIGAVAIR